MNEIGNEVSTHFRANGLKFYGYVGLFTVLIAEILMLMKIEPFLSYFYLFAWYGYIFFIDSVIFKLKGNSLIASRTKEFLVMLPWSTLVWLVFEFYNVYIGNWRYRRIDNDWLGPVGTALCFATVLPGIFETAEFIETMGIFRRATVKRWKITPRLLYTSIGIGIITLIIPFLLPKYTFPLVWGSFIFFLDPINYLLREKSLLGDLENGRATKIYSLLSGGLACGLLWEFWNFWAGAKWEYTVPFVGEFLKIFEMPLLGFLGFPPFALECYVMYNFIMYFQKPERAFIPKT
jgi:hypothetical protein